MTTPAIRPLVYVGPSAARDDVTRWLPDALVRPPITRGDLYRDRMLRYSFFVVLDGVFLQSQAIPPREVIDVIRDGGVVIGAASMGALRAAECWPAGMIGVGAIYRQFRRGYLGSDDEVAVTFDPDAPFPSLTVSLVNVRHAVRAEVRAGTVSSGDSAGIVAAAQNLFYADRTWPDILGAAGVDPGIAASLARHDRKRADAIRALRVASWMIERQPQLLGMSRASRRPFATSEATRERIHASFGSRASNASDISLLQWLIAAGAMWKLMGLDPAASRRRRDVLDAMETAIRAVGAGDPVTIGDLVRRLEASDEADALWLRFNALTDAVDLAKARGWQPDPAHLAAAGCEIATGHGSEHFGRLLVELEPARDVCEAVERYRDELALAKQVRQALFEYPGASRRRA